MKILFLTQILPFPPDAGPRVKTWHVLRALAKQGHSVTLVSFVRPEEAQHLPVLEKVCSSVHAVPLQRSRFADVGHIFRSFFRDRPFLVERDDLRPMQDVVNDLIRQGGYDVIHADQLTMAQFALRGAKLAGGETKVVFDAHNATWTILERMRLNTHWLLKPILAVETKRLKRYEGDLLKKVDHVLTVTDADRAGLEEASSLARSDPDERIAPITVVPIATDTRQLRPIIRQPASKNLVTLGTLHYPPNADGIRWFFIEVFPLIRRQVPGVTLTIIGKNPPRDFVEFAARRPDVVKVTGYVRELPPYLEQSALMVVPVRAGGGMRVRILEAFAYAMPVVTTTIGLEGIHAEPGKDVLVADTPTEFADRVITLLKDSGLQEELSKNARLLAETKYDWQVALAAMKLIYGK
jgi:glycosyltransferase involved in cell wall biosynthesis